MVFVQDPSLAEESLLAGCVNCRQLSLCLNDPAKRLQAPPPGVRVKYEPHPVTGTGEVFDFDV